MARRGELENVDSGALLHGCLGAFQRIAATDPRTDEEKAELFDEIKRVAAINAEQIESILRKGDRR